MKPCLRRFGNNEGADQPAHPCTMISAFVINTAYQAVLPLIVFKLLCPSLPNFPSSFAGLFLT